MSTINPTTIQTYILYQIQNNKKQNYTQQYLFTFCQMTSATYLDKLKNIREKYGYAESLPKNTTSHHIPSTRLYQPPKISTYQKQRYQPGEFKPKVSNYQEPASPAFREVKYSYRDRSDLDQAVKDIRENYARSRRKILQGNQNHQDASFSRKKPVDRAAYDRAESLQEEENSPIKRIKDFPESQQSKRETSLSNPENYWREREAKLNELTNKKLNDRSHNFQAEKQKPAKILAQHYQEYKQISSPPKRRNYDLGTENYQNDYSVTGIDRIQTRIQSILGSARY